MNKLKEKLSRGEMALGTHILFNESRITELVGGLGYDYLWIDTEHTALSLDDVERHLDAARLAGVTSLVRIPWNDPVRAKPVLEMGPGGLIFPMVNSYEEALLAVRSCLYPPRGIRGFGPRRANNFGLIPLDEYIEQANNEVMRIIQIEHIDAVRDLDRITTIQDIDAYIIGPMDLSASMGKIGKLNDPEVVATFEEIIAKVHAAGKPVGLSLGLLDEAGMAVWKQRGIDFISLACESDFVIAQGTKLLESMKRTML